MILTDDNFATIVAAVEGGRGLYDNLRMKYIRVQMIMLAGFILTFLGAGFFDALADGVSPPPPADPLDQLRRRRPPRLRARLRRRHPRPHEPQTPITRRTRHRRPSPSASARRPPHRHRHPRRRRRGEDRCDLATATTMGLTTISSSTSPPPSNGAASTTTIFTPSHHRQRPLRLLMLAALTLTFLVTTIDGLQRIFDTVDLLGPQWRACLIPVIAYIALAETGKLILRHMGHDPR